MPKLLRTAPFHVRVGSLVRIVNVTGTAPPAVGLIYRSGRFSGLNGPQARSCRDGSDGTLSKGGLRYGLVQSYILRLFARIHDIFTMATVRSPLFPETGLGVVPFLNFICSKLTGWINETHIGVVKRVPSQQALAAKLEKRKINNARRHLASVRRVPN